ncbi:acyl-CoA dehydrogenase family protein [Tepidiforma flava]|uniref:Acyl-CoA dehydrogenase family protein n=1 Tax=Tepidiforma flava TaxID=3004094 RepID=A0ABY7MCQ0_9CHLR|nr:acyl-CoA dehydrogenase family protein [Tepidiforma flava]WBL37528.1 acyl-CoA dehydrogenase family protein [Tepidiforma flava]
MKEAPPRHASSAIRPSRPPGGRKSAISSATTSLESIRGVTGFFYDPRTDPAFGQWRDALVRRGWIAPAWPKEYGGAGMSVVEQFILNQEFAQRRGAPVSRGWASAS